jgi:cell shape-determining protein MreC
MQELLTAISTLNQFGWLAITVFVVFGFISGIVLTRGHHKEVIEGFKERINEYDQLTRELRAENQQLRQALMITQGQATRATAVTASVVDQVRGGS